MVHSGMSRRSDNQSASTHESVEVPLDVLTHAAEMVLENKAQLKYSRRWFRRPFQTNIVIGVSCLTYNQNRGDELLLSEQERIAITNKIAEALKPYDLEVVLVSLEWTGCTADRFNSHHDWNATILVQ